MFRVNNKDTRIRKVTDKVKNKDSVEVVLASLLLTCFISCYKIHIADFDQLIAG